MDIVEVLRGTVASPLLLGASGAGMTAAVATVLAVAAWWAATSVTTSARSEPTPATATRRRSVRWLLVIAVAASVTEVGLLLLDGATLTGRWIAVALVRLLLLVALLLLGDRTQAGASRWLGGSLSAVLLATAVLGAPTATGALPAGAAGMVIATVAAAVLLVAGRWVAAASARADAVGLLAPLALLVAVALPLAIVTLPDRVPPHQQDQLAVGSLTLDVTVAPLTPGTNEFHVYAFGPDGLPAPLEEVHVEVVGEPTTRHQLFPVSPDHHLSYVLELPDADRWELEVSLLPPGSDPERFRWAIAPPE